MSKLYVNEIKPKTSGNIVTGLSNVLEVLAMNCDGGTYTVPSGTYTAPNVTSVMSASSSHDDLTGSIITYAPPTGATAVLYEFSANYATGNDTRVIMSMKFYVDGSEVVYARRGIDGNYGGGLWNFRWVIPIGGTADSNTGRLASWTSGNELKITFREYSASYEGRFHIIQEFDGSGTDVFAAPTLTITALGGAYNG